MQGEGRFRRTTVFAKPVRPAVLLAAFFFWGATLSLAEGPVKTEPVVVTATRIEEKVSEQASPVSVVTREEIDLSGSGLVGDALQGLPGVDIQRKGSPGGMENIKIRGGLASHTLVLIDGFPVNSPAIDGAYDVSTLPVGRFDRIEVVRGPQSALYGSNAMSGVVNFLPPVRRGRRGTGPARRRGASPRCSGTASRPGAPDVGDIISASGA